MNAVFHFTIYLFVGIVSVVFPFAGSAIGEEVWDVGDKGGKSEDSPPIGSMILITRGKVLNGRS